MSEDMADLQIWLDRKFKAIDERIRKIEQSSWAEERADSDFDFAEVRHETIRHFCDAFGITTDEELLALRTDIEAFDNNLDDSWTELQGLREKTEDMNENLGDVLERVDTASQLINDLRNDL